MPKTIIPCKMHGHLTELPCDASDCPLYGDCISEAKKTNADRIRAMSDEELAEFLSDDERACPPKWHNCRKHINECGGCWLEWLKQPAEAPQ